VLVVPDFEEQGRTSFHIESSMVCAAMLSSGCYITLTSRVSRFSFQHFIGKEKKGF
jgi:hypothetical protein